MMNWSHLRDLFGNIQLVCRLQTDNYAHLSLLPNQVVDAHVSTIAALGLQRFLKFATPTPVPTPEVGVVTPELTPLSVLNFKEITTISCNKEIYLGICC